jgi:uncharacterized membrane protein
MYLIINIFCRCEQDIASNRYKKERNVALAREQKEQKELFRLILLSLLILLIARSC